MKYNVTHYGAVGDGIAKDTLAIQKAIDDCHEHGGGVVVLESGKVYQSGSIVLKSNVELHIESGAVLKASHDLADYAYTENAGIPKSDSGVPSYINCEYDGRPPQYFIYAHKGENIRITGFGTIDGSEEMYHGKEGTYHIEGAFYPRIPLILIEEINHLTVRDVTMTKSGFWTLHMAGCNDVLVDGIRILNSLKMANSDGIDPDHCRNVRIVNCHIECADDCIVLKNTKAYEEYGPCTDILISGCTLTSTSSAIKFGTESESDFRNVVIQNCCINRTNRGISMQLRDKGNIENVIISNIHIQTRRFSEQWWGRAEPIYITARNRKEGVVAGQIRNVTIENVFCEGQNGVFIDGSEDHIIRNLSLRNIHINLKKTSKWDSDSYDIRPCTTEGIIPSKIYGVYIDYAQNVKLENVCAHCDDSMLHCYGGERKTGQFASDIT